MTGSLLFVASVCRLAELSDCRIVLRVLRVSADLWLYIVGSVSRTVIVDQIVAIMVTGAGLKPTGQA